LVGLAVLKYVAGGFVLLGVTVFYTFSGHDLRYFTLTLTLSQWEREQKEIAAYNRSKYKKDPDRQSQAGEACCRYRQNGHLANRLYGHRGGPNDINVG
jgi:hypothetical protein